MQEKFTITTVILLVGALQGFFLSFFVYSQKNNSRRTPSIFISLLIFIVSLLLLLAAIYETANLNILVYMMPAVFPAFLLIGPLLYFYTYSLTHKNFKLKPIYLLHLIPYLIALVLFTNQMYFSSIEERVYLNQFYKGYVPPVEIYFRIFDFISRAVYTAISIKILIDFKRNLKNEFSDIEKIDLDWLRNILILASVSLMIYLIVIVFNLGNYYRLYIGIIFAILTYVVGYFFIRDKSIKPIEINSDSKSKYEKSGLTIETKNKIYSELKRLMENEKLYLNPEISAGRLSQMLSISPNHLSQVLNEVFEKNFFEFINSYRIEEAKKLLIIPDSGSNVLQIGFEVGFQSKTTFNTVFKKITKQTPTEFRKNHI